MNEFEDKLKTALAIDDKRFLEKNLNNDNINYRFKEDDNDTIILYAISDGFSEAYKYILLKKPDLTLVNDLGENIAHSVVYSGKKNRLNEIFDLKKINLNHQTIEGVTPLLLAISIEDFEMANFLIDYGADINIADNNGISPIHLAVQSSDIRIVKKLIKAGADLSSMTSAGNLPLALAVNYGNTQIIKLLFNKIYN